MGKTLEEDFQKEHKNSNGCTSSRSACRPADPPWWQHQSTNIKICMPRWSWGKHLKKTSRKSTRTRMVARLQDLHAARIDLLFESARTRTYTPYILQKARAHHIFYRITGEETLHRDTAQNIPMRTCTPQSSIANTACSVRAPHLLQSLLRFLCSCAEAGHMQMSGHGLTSCAAIDESRKVEYKHRQYTLHYTLRRNCNLCNER